MRRCVLVDNRLSETIELTQAINSLGWNAIPRDVQTEHEHLDDSEITTYATLILEDRPDIVAVDAALTSSEEELLSVLDEANTWIDPREFSGLVLLAKLKEMSPSLPVAMISKSVCGGLSRAATDLGARPIVVKDSAVNLPNEQAAKILQAGHRMLCCEPSMYDELEQCINTCVDIDNEAAIVRPALEGFYRNTTPARRLGLLCKKLSPLMSVIFTKHTDRIVDTLCQRLVDTQVLLSLVDRNLRDHARHSGNVFWCGYYILKQLPEYRDIAHLEKLKGFTEKAYASADTLALPKQLLTGWVLASLFHDIAYADEKAKQVDTLLKRVYPDGSDRMSGAIPGNVRAIEPLIEFLKPIERTRKTNNLRTALKWMVKFWGEDISMPSDTSTKTRVCDHGVLGAVRFLECMDTANVKDEFRPLLYHVALAIAVHNLPQWRKKWRAEENQLTVQVPIGRYPLCNLLAICDTIQTWDREGGDPLFAQSEQELFERYILLQSAYLEHSELTGISLDTSAQPYKIGASISYKVTPGDNTLLVLENLHRKIEDWINGGDAKDVASTFSLSNLFRVTLEYDVPAWPKLETTF